MAMWADQREFLGYKSDIAHLATTVECSNELSTLDSVTSGCCIAKCTCKASLLATQTLINNNLP